MVKCIYCDEDFKEGDLLQAFLRSPDDPKGSWTNPVEVDGKFQERAEKNGLGVPNGIRRKHLRCTLFGEVEILNLDSPETNVFVPDYKFRCSNCNEVPTVKIETKSGKEVTHMEMCGPCTFGTAKALNVDEWNTQEDW